MKHTPRTDAALDAVIELGGELQTAYTPLISLARTLEGERAELLALAQYLRDGLALAMDGVDGCWTYTEQRVMAMALGACSHLRDLEQDLTR